MKQFSDAMEPAMKYLSPIEQVIRQFVVWVLTFLSDISGIFILLLVFLWFYNPNAVKYVILTIPGFVNSLKIAVSPSTNHQDYVDIHKYWVAASFLLYAEMFFDYVFMKFIPFYTTASTIVYMFLSAHPKILTGAYEFFC